MNITHGFSVGEKITLPIAIRVKKWWNPITWIFPRYERIEQQEFEITVVDERLVAIDSPYVGHTSNPGEGEK